ncbi:hypothetical protein [Flavobacterium flavigenum]|uniref:hypothetical protein n=1 Tax=Flavobacterium flavigenum TaxID=3003258 RepID=UPI0024828D6F|nr:hypothetical protein [Flavobacterium flavigenum]
MTKTFLIVSIFLLFSIIAKSQNENIKGDYYIKLIDVHDLFNGMPKDLKEKMNKIISNPNYEKEYSDSEKKGIQYYMFLSQNNLLDNPRFKLKVDGEKIINVFTTNKEFVKIKTKIENFDKYEEHIVINFEGIKKSEGFFGEPIYYADKINSVEKVLGESDWKK